MMERWGVVVVAAGRGTRMGTAESKQYLQLNGKPIIVHTLQNFQAMAFIDEIVLVVGKDDIARCQQWCEQYRITKVKAIIPGGAERQYSVHAGLEEIKSQWVLVHDGVRPFVTEAAVARCCKQAVIHGAAVLAVPVKDTIKQVNHEGVITATPDRKSLWAIQTPQAFRHELLLDAHVAAEQAGMLGTDDASVAEWRGAKVVVAEGEYTNIKITTPEDLPWAQLLLQNEEVKGDNSNND
ncbi:2-C-methyl-D-erythritol 4-phosphate cytidylyltransferase [Paenibacillus camelliae]|uniref:2-C-methyl-D-erythritol 4-phosphate cytidylyltransferase n=1 Tax=Paenibacillus camelliae TaxID=512410 RepID=UPI00203F66FE|nr:2-C-methyl-D-erythritol 4-phosphate cytidylyltransferase [Paenibacillus camelliae]MCM3635714.1 2-C-methyl-D-erythritol 4-phosphate cytidylyltransferase [Paenibacillus camelliae]